MLQGLFWLYLGILVLPLPFKIYGYARGSDDSPMAVRIEECANAGFFLFGLLAFHGYLHQRAWLTPWVWWLWLAMAIGWSVAGVFISPKLQHLKTKMSRELHILMTVSTLLYLPQLVVTALYALHFPQ